ncbi:unnamed protein product [Lactuca saligna]|uniref:Exocyst subunit Exo70 family protein n=1 Tax=Lactuca saligna TaxID=75948 RepID=A0AA35ZX43_LACSI|nr:unnamed protein product [Lactuca saligna]
MKSPNFLNPRFFSLVSTPTLTHIHRLQSSIATSAHFFSPLTSGDLNSTLPTGDLEFISPYRDSGDDEDDEFDDVEIPVDHPVPDYNIMIEALLSSTINDLHEITKRMVATGYGKECSLAYSTCWREFLEESLSRLGFLGLHNSSKPLEDADNDVEIKKWVKAINMDLRVFYPSLRRLCE